MAKMATIKNSKEIVEQLRQELEKQGKSKAWLARECGMGRTWITQTLNGKQTLTKRTALIMAYTLGIRIEFETEE